MERKVGFETLNQALNDEIFQSQIKAKYKSKIFIGYFKEKRLCEKLKCYRDSIVIDTKVEHEFAKDLDCLSTELNAQFRSNNVFIGLTKVEENYTISTEVDEELPFGKYWFQV